MVVLVEELPGVTLKRKGAEEPGLFVCSDDGAGSGDGEGFPLSGHATKIRRLAGADHHDAPAAMGGGGAGGDVVMGEAPPLPGLAGEQGALVVYDPSAAGAGKAARGRGGLLDRWWLRPWAPLRAGGEWIREMMREADSRTVQGLLTGAREDGAGGMAVVPWSAAPPPPAAAATEEASAAAESVDEEDGEATAAMDIEEELGHHAQLPVVGCGEGFFRRWPQHCMPPPQLPAVGHASPVTWT